MPSEAAACAPPVANELVRVLFVLLKAASVYERGNDGYRRHSAAARQTLARALAEHGGARLEARGDQLFFNSRRVRVRMEDSAGARFILGELGRRGIGGVDFTRACDPSAVDAFAYAFRAAAAGGANALALMRERLDAEAAAGVAVLPRASGADGGGGERRAAQRAFYLAVSVVEDAMTQAREGREASFAPAKRVVQALAERVVEDEQALFELATLHSFDEYTFVHSVNVCVYSISIGARLGLARGLLADLGFAALFHDLGKARLPIELIDKPDAFDEDDWAKIRRHPALGARSLLAMRRGFDPALARAVVTAFDHHRGLDGAGYPRLTRARPQGLFARVCAIADSFDAMTSGRVYTRTPLGPAQALRRLIARSGTAYDPFLLRVFVQAVGVFPIGTPLILDDGRVGVVWRNDSADLLRPKVRVLSGAPGAAAEVVDLAARDPATGRPSVGVARLADPAALGVDVQRYLAAVDLPAPDGATAPGAAAPGMENR